MSIGFQLIPASATDGYGVQAYGTTAYGGGAAEPLVLPKVEVGSDDPERDLRRIVGESVHTRDGVVIGSRAWAKRRAWRFVFRRQPEATIVSLQTYFLARVFRFLPDATDDVNFYRVKWMAQDWPPPVQRGRTYDVDILLQEV